MEDNYNKWIIDSNVVMDRLKSTKLGFLKYEDLTYENYLMKSIGEVDHKYERRQTSNWYDFTSGRCDLTVQRFKEHLLRGISSEEHFLLFTDEGHGMKWLFTLLVNDLDNFADWYEDYFNREFYEFSEYVLIFPNLDMVIFNDDEGGINEFLIL